VNLVHLQMTQKPTETMASASTEFYAVAKENVKPSKINHS